ncbi:MAG TPA: hypothetical protein VIQ74_12305 [Gemmatimonadaceae bacterium]|jgi:hypothetical protein
MKLHSSGDRRGFALVVALAALVIIGGLIAGAFFASTQEFRIGRNTVLQSRAMTAAEYGLNSALRGDLWHQEWNNNTEAGKKLEDRTFVTGDGSVGNLRVTNLGNDNFFVVSEGFAGASLGAQGRKRIGGLVTLLKPDFNFLGAVTTRGNIKVTGSTQIHGEDTSPDLWTDCGASAATKPGIVVGSTSDANVSCLDKGCVTGDPPVQPDPNADSVDTYDSFGDLNYDGLVALATKTIDGGKTFTGLGPAWYTDPVGNVFCDRKVESNWGDPEHLDTKTSCRPYFPIIHIKGDVHLSGGAGQGILLVDGNLTASGGVMFTGPVIVRGTLSVTGNGTGARFLGGVMAQNVDLADNMMSGNAVVSYSSCAIEKAVKGSATPMFETSRGWVEMY